MTEQDIEEHVAKAVADERNRCTRLVIMRADISRASAAKMRASGTYKAQEISWRWPWIRAVSVVQSGSEQRARECEAAARAFDVVAACIMRGYDPADINDPSATIDLTKWRNMKIGPEL